VEIERKDCECDFFPFLTLICNGRISATKHGLFGILVVQPISGILCPRNYSINHHPRPHHHPPFITQTSDFTSNHPTTLTSNPNITNHNSPPSFDTLLFHPIFIPDSHILSYLVDNLCYRDTHTRIDWKRLIT
jgi:hypothetical protein